MNSLVTAMKATCLLSVSKVYCNSDFLIRVFPLKDTWILLIFLV